MYENQRLILSPTLIVGLGGTGSLGVQWAKKSIKKYLKSYGLFDPTPTEIDSFQYLSIDTTFQSMFVEWLVDNEKFNLGVTTNPLRVIKNKQELPNYARAYKWLPNKLRIGQISSGAGGERLLGRLGFFENQQKLQSVLRGKIDAAKKNETDSYIERSFKNVKLERDHLHVHIICSLAGGTGSACLLDTAYLIRNIVGENQAKITAHLVTYEPFTERGLLGKTGEKYAKRNFIVTLSEIERFMDFSIGREGWNVFYPNGTTIESNEEVFNDIYILGYKKLISLSVNNICEIIGESIAMKTARPEGRKYNDDNRNLDDARKEERDGRRQNKRYSSYKIAISSCEWDESWVRFYVKQIIIETLHTEKSPTHKMLNEINEKFHFEEEISLDVTLSFALRDYFEDQKNFYNKIEYRIRKIIENRSRIEVKKKIWTRTNTPAKWDDEKMADHPNARSAIDFVSSAFFLKLKEFRKKLFAGLDAYFYNLVLDSGSLPLLISLLTKLLEDMVMKAEDELFVGKAKMRKDADEEGKNQTIKQYINIVLFPKLRKELASLCDDLKASLEKLKLKCESANSFLYDLGVEERGHSSASSVIDTVWTPNEMKGALTKKKDDIVKNFIELLNARSSASWELSMAFLNYLKDSLGNKQIIIESIDTISDLVKKDSYGFERGLTLIKTETLENLYKKSKPSWIADNEGDVFEQIITTNIPEGEVYYDELSKLAKKDLSSINKTKDDFKRDGQLMVFQTEHLASACQLHSFREAVKAVESNLKSEGKTISDLKDFSLDKDWKIEIPISDKNIPALRLNFLLGSMFGRIKYDRERNVYTFDGASVSGQLPKFRFEAFEIYVQNYFARNQSIRELLSSIDKEEEERKKDIPNFLEEIKKSCLHRVDELIKEQDEKELTYERRMELSELMSEKEEIENYINHLMEDHNREKIESNGDLS